MEFCYIVQRLVLDNDDIDKLNTLLVQFHQERKIFREAGIRSNFCLPRQHSLNHYANSIMKFGAPNSLCSSITESKHIEAVKKPWRRSSRFNALGQMLLTNQRLDKLAAARVDFKCRGMLVGTCLAYTIFALKSMGWAEKHDTKPVMTNPFKTLKIEIVETGPKPASSENEVML